MGGFFKNQDYGRTIWKHINLPIYVTDEFVFYRCVEFNDNFYGKTASELFNGNLRYCTGRYTNLFPNQKLSYWTDSPETARAEIKKHGAGNNILTFCAYDDATSTFPCLPDQEVLVIVDGRKCGVQELIDKLDSNVLLTEEEHDYFNQILKEEPDCLVYDSHARIGGENYIFFEKGFKKLALREIKLRFGRAVGGAHNQIWCAGTCDYVPYLENYAKCFFPKARIGKNEEYYKSVEYLERKQMLEISRENFGREGNE